VLHNAAQNSSDTLPSYPPDNHHSSDVMEERASDGVEKDTKSFSCTTLKHLHPLNAR